MKKAAQIAGLLMAIGGFCMGQTAEVYKSDAVSAETQENFELAAVTWEQAANAFKEQEITDTTCIFRAGYNYFRVKQYAKALPFLQECILLNYKPSVAYPLMADAYQSLNDARKAEEVLLAGRAAVPGAAAELDKKLAYLCFNTGQYERAAAAFGQLNNSFPENQNYMYLYGFSLERVKRYDEAVTVLQAAHLHFPDDEKIRKMLGVALFEQTDLLNEQEVKRYESLKNAKIADYIGTRKKLEQINAGYAKARGVLEESLKDFPGDKLVISSLYKIYKKEKNPAKAAEMEKLLK